MVMVGVSVKMNGQTNGMHDHGILDVGIKLDVKVQYPSSAVFWEDFDNAFAIHKIRAIK